MTKGAAIYNIFTLGSGFDKDLWIQFVKVLPALFGALTIIAMYFFAKKTYSKEAAVVTALIAGVVPSYVYRTFEFEDDSLGFLWLIIGFVFLARAVKEPSMDKKNLINALISGIFFGVMAWTWGFFRILPVLLGGYFILALLLFYLTKRDLVKPFIANMGISFISFAIIY